MSAGKGKKIALILPFHTDSGRLKNTQRAIEERLALDPLAFEEIILCQNNALVPFNEKARRGPPFRYLHTEKKGIGEGYALGIAAAKSDWVLLSASDLPFGFSDLEAMKADGMTADLYLGSKLHPLSEMGAYSFLRITCSWIFLIWRLIFLGKKTPKDSQGTILVGTDAARALLAQTRSRDFFFSVEFIYRAQKNGLTVREVPVKLNAGETESSVNLVRDGLAFLVKVIALRWGGGRA